MCGAQCVSVCDACCSNVGAMRVCESRTLCVRAHVCACLYAHVHVRVRVGKRSTRVCVCMRLCACARPPYCSAPSKSACILDGPTPHRLNSYGPALSRPPSPTEPVRAISLHLMRFSRPERVGATTYQHGAAAGARGSGGSRAPIVTEISTGGGGD